MIVSANNRSSTKLLVRMLSAVTALLVIMLYALTAARDDSQSTAPLHKHLGKKSYPSSLSRRLLYLGDGSYGDSSYGDGSYGDGSYGDNSACGGDEGDDVDNRNCTEPLHDRGNESCSYVKNYCSDDVALANYLAFIVCDLPHVKVRCLRGVV